MARDLFESDVSGADAGAVASAANALQYGMTEITLVLPFALPPPELAPDLVRALQAPSLAALLSRTSAHRPRGDFQPAPVGQAENAAEP